MIKRTPSAKTATNRQDTPQHLRNRLVEAIRGQTCLWLEKAYQERSDGLTYVNVEPAFDFLRSDPRFQNLLRRMNLEP